MQHLAHMWKKLMKNVDIDEPTSFLDDVFLGCTPRECKPKETIIEQYTKMFKSRISAGSTEELSGWQKPHAQTAAWSNDMEGHAPKCVERYCELANKKVEQLYDVLMLAWMIIHSSRKNSNQLENCQQFARKLSWNAGLWHGMDDLTSYGPWTKWQDQSQNGPRHVTEDEQGLFLKFITRMTVVNIVMWEPQQSTADLGLFLDWDFAGDREDLKSTSGGVLCMFGGRTFVPASRMRKKQTSVSHSSAESEVISLDAGLRMDGLLALDLWDIVIEVLRSTKDNIQPKHTTRQEKGSSWFQNQDPTCHKKTGWPTEWSGSRTHHHTFFSKGISVVHFWRQRSCDPDDNQKD